MRTCPSPEGPKLAPGVTTTPAFSMSSSQNAMESVRPPGSLAHTNIEPCALGRSQPSPQDRRTGHRDVPGTSGAAPRPHRAGPFRQAIAAFWIGKNIPKSIWPRSLAKAETTSSRPTKKPMRAPVTLNDLKARRTPRPPQAHRDTARSCRRARRQTRCRSTRCRER